MSLKHFSVPSVLFGRKGLWLSAAMGVCVAISRSAEPAGAAAVATSPVVITSAQQFWMLTDAEKSERHSARIPFTVYYHDPYWKLLWGRSGETDLYWPISSSAEVIPEGRNILLEGTVVPAKGPAIDGEKITVLPSTSDVEVVSAGGEMANATRLNCRVVVFDAYVNRQTETDANHLTLDLAVEGRPVTSRMLLASDSPVPQLEGAFVRVKGTYVPTFDAGGKLAQLDVWVGKKEDVTILGWIESDARFNLPATPIEKLSDISGATLVRVVGLVQAQQPGKSLTIRDETGQLELKTAETRAVESGERIEAIGYPLTTGLESSLQQSLYRRVQTHTPPVNLGLPKLRVAEQVKELHSDGAARGYPVRLSGVVTWSDPRADFFFLQDATGGIKVLRPPHSAAVFASANRVEVTGVSRAGEFSSEVQATDLVEISPMALPEIRTVTLEQAMTGIEEAKWVSMSGYVRDIRVEGAWSTLNLTTSAGEFTAIAPANPEFEKLRGAVVRLSGVCSATANVSHQLTGIQLWVLSPDQVEIQEPAPADPFAIPTRTTRSLREFSLLVSLGRRVQVQGVVLAHTPGRYLRIEDAGESLLVFTHDTLPLAIGDRVKVVGIPGRQSGRLVMREAIYQRVSAGVTPPPIELHEPAAIDADLDGHLVNVEGTLLETSSRPEGVRLTMRARNLSFDALLDAPIDAAAGENWPKGSRVRLTGVYEVQFDEYLHPSGFALRMRLPQDVQVVTRPPWWTAQRTWMLAAVLAVGTLLGLAWAIALRRQVRRQTAEIRAQWEKGARLESELLRASKLESLGLLAGGIAHDFNNLLMVMMGNATLVLHDRNLDEESRSYLREVEKAARRGRDLTKQLLTFAKGGAPLRTPVDLARVVREAAGFAVHDSPVRCEFDFAGELWPAEADKGQMAQVVHNVVLNAVQAMPTGGVVKIALRNEELAADDVPTLKRGRYLKMSIADSGAGIQPDHLSRIFDPYFTTKQHGSGLGLATVYSIVKRHDGYLSVGSKLGEGTTFQIWLPASAEKVETPPPMPTATPRRGKVLFMDDEAFIRNIAVTLLRRIDCEPTVVSDGADAVQAFANARAVGKPYDVVILDLTVPGGIGGAEAMAQIRAIDPSVRAIVSSGYSSNPVMANYQEYGFKAAVPKPYEVEELMRAVQRLLHDHLGAN
jgi:two-component system cell cycle sensor histidine kinase/response regulator CckA